MTTNRIRCLLCLLFAGACSKTAEPSRPVVDAASPDQAPAPGPDLLPDQSEPDAGLVAAVPEAGGAAPDLAADQAQAAPDAGIEAPAPEAGDARGCLWPNAVRYTLHHFDFTVTTPNGTKYGRSSFAPDAASTILSPLLGVVAESESPVFKLDTCLPGTGCQPAVYTFSLSPSDIQVRLPVGRKIRVDWQLVAPGGFAPGTGFLAVHDADDGITQDALLLAGAGGMSVDDNATYKPDGLPFNFTLHRQNCGRSKADVGYQLGDDFTMTVVRRDGLGQPLALATGEAGSLDYALASGSLESIGIHCLSAVQPSATDDYWNWDFWLGSDQTGLDGGTE